MNKKKSKIVARENEPLSIEKLIASKEIYSKAKRIFYLQFSLSIVLLITLSLLQLIISHYDLTILIATVSILVIFADNYLELYIHRLKEKAAKVQEFFDTYVLNINWNQILCEEKPEFGLIHKFARNSNVDKNRFNNWYEDEIEKVPQNIGSLICQKTNCNYDSEIRERYNNVVLSIGIIAIILIFLFATLSDFSSQKLILTVIFPLAPIIQWTHKNILVNKNSIKQLKALNSALNELWKDAKNDNKIYKKDIRGIQDGIFLNRKENPLIPDFVYDKLRPNLENQTRYSVEQLVSEYLNK